MEKKDLTFIQDQIGYNFQNTDLLRQAFTRRSYSKESGGEENYVELIQEWTVKKYGMVPWYHFENFSEVLVPQKTKSENQYAH